MIYNVVIIMFERKAKIMLFTDKAKIYVEAGAGGDGASSFRRENSVKWSMDSSMRSLGL